MIYTFYSYKGGVGRTMTLANIAELFYRAGLKVLMVDWDIEAPGLERYFCTSNLEEILDKPGLIDMLLRYKELMAQEQDPDISLQLESPISYITDLYSEHVATGKLFLLTAGRRFGEHFASYAEAVLNFDWRDFYKTWEGELYFEWLRTQFEQIADIVLIDSRTGISELSGVCTYQLADVVLMLCSLNQQSLDGTYEMLQNFSRPEVQRLRHKNPIEVLVIPARVEDRAETQFLHILEEQFKAKFDQFLPHILRDELRSFWNLKIPHVPHYAFNENVAVRDKVHGDLIKSFELLFKVLGRLATSEETKPNLLSTEPSESLVEIEKAINIYIATEAWHKIATLFEVQGRSLYNLNSDWVEYLEQWLSQIPTKELEERPRLLLLQGIVLGELNQREASVPIFQQAEKLFNKQGDLVGTAEAQIMRSVQLRLMGVKVQESVELASKGVALLEVHEVGDWLMAWAIRNRGNAYAAVNDLEASLKDLGQALKIFESEGDTYRVGLCHMDMGVSFEEMGKLTSAEIHYKQAKHIWETLGDKENLAKTLNNSGVLLCIMGDFDEAIKKLNESLTLTHQINDINLAAAVQTSLGDAYLGAEDYERAITSYTTAVELAKCVNVNWVEVYSLTGSGEYFYRKNKLAEALTLANRASEIAVKQGLIYYAGLVYILQARIYTRLGEYPMSSSLLKSAAACFESNILEQVKTQLWWGYSLLLDLRSWSAFIHIQQAVQLALTLGDLTHRIKDTVGETQRVLLHFQYRIDISSSLKNSISHLLDVQGKMKINPSKPVLQIFAFGSPSLTLVGTQRQFSEAAESHRLPELLLYFVLESRNSGCRWSVIKNAIWPELGADSALDIFQQNLKLLGDIWGEPSAIVVQDDYYRINTDYLDWCDVFAFETLLQRADKTALDKDLDLYQEIIELYQGDLFSGFTLGNWGLTRRAFYKTKFLQNVKLVSEHLAEIGLYEEALSIINKGLIQDFLVEDLHHIAFKIYGRLKQHSNLRISYLELCKRLEKESGKQPEPLTKHIYEQLMTETDYIKQ